MSLVDRVALLAMFVVILLYVLGHVILATDTKMHPAAKVFLFFASHWVAGFLVLALFLIHIIW